MHKLVLATICGAILSIPVMSTAETVTVPIGQQASEKQSMPRPQLGMTKVQVKEQFGEPLDWREAVGDPPISSWVYGDFTVYFEYEYVIHSVLRPPQQPAN